MGDYPADAFFSVDSQTGLIRLSRSVTLDSLLTNTYHVKLIAYDTVYPNMQATSTATIYVNRNPNPPVLNPSVYNREYSENVSPGILVVDVNGTDADGVRVQVSVLAHMGLGPYGLMSWL